MELTQVEVGDIVEVLWNDTWHDAGYLEEYDEIDPEWPRILVGIVARVLPATLVVSPDWTPRERRFDTYWVLAYEVIRGVRFLGRIDDVKPPAHEQPGAGL
jgi:hypothetical protein